jgi:hypothetical protein
MAGAPYGNSGRPQNFADIITKRPGGKKAVNNSKRNAKRRGRR